MFPYTLAAFKSSINPFVWVRGILVDLGIVEFAEKLEGIFGKPVMYALYCVGCLYLFMLCVTGIFGFVDNAISLMESARLTDRVKGWVSYLAVYCGIIVFISLIAWRKVTRKMRESNASIEAAVDEGIRTLECRHDAIIRENDRFHADFYKEYKEISEATGVKIPGMDEMLEQKYGHLGKSGGDES